MASSCAGPVADEDQRKGEAEEGDEVVLAALLEGLEHLPQHEERDEEAPQGHEPVDPGGQVSRRSLFVVLVGDLVDVDAPGVARGLGRRSPRQRGGVAGHIDSSLTVT